MTICYLQTLLSSSLFWSLQAIFPKEFSPMVLTWWKIWCLPHQHSCGAPFWMVYFPSWTHIPSLFFQAFLDPHKNTNADVSMILVQPSLVVCRVPLFWIIIYGLPRLFCLTSPVSLIPQGLLFQIPLWACLGCVFPCVSESFQIPGC